MQPEDNNIYALSIADAMAAMMLIFTLVLLVLALRLGSIQDKTTEIERLHRILDAALEHNKNEAQQYFSMKQAIYQALIKEFSADLKKWNARIDKNSLAFIMENSKNGFEAGKSEIPPEFRAMLDQFVPRYIKVIQQYGQHVNEIRIEGHTSSEWGVNLAECQDSGSEACKKSVYLKNMRLSQDRAMSVLNYILLMENISDMPWLRSKLTANGLSSSHLLCGKQKAPCSGNHPEQENREASRRVEFSVRTNAESTIEEMMKAKNKRP